MKNKLNVGSSRKNEMDTCKFQFIPVYSFLDMQSTLSSTAERVESVASDLKKEFGEQHVWVPTAELLASYIFIHKNRQNSTVQHV